MDAQYLHICAKSRAITFLQPNHKDLNSDTQRLELFWAVGTRRDQSVLVLVLLCLHLWRITDGTVENFLYCSPSLSPPTGGTATANHLPPSDPVLCLLLSHTKQLLVFLCSVHESPLCSSSRAPSCQFQPLHSTADIFTS